jgi:hypothetical protein
VRNEKPPKKVPENKVNGDLRPRIPSGYKTGKELKEMIN